MKEWVDGGMGGWRNGWVGELIDGQMGGGNIYLSKLLHLICEYSVHD